MVSDAHFLEKHGQKHDINKIISRTKHNRNATVSHPFHHPYVPVWRSTAIAFTFSVFARRKVSE